MLYFALVIGDYMMMMTMIKKKVNPIKYGKR